MEEWEITYWKWNITMIIISIIGSITLMKLNGF